MIRSASSKDKSPITRHVGQRALSPHIQSGRDQLNPLRRIHSTDGMFLGRESWSMQCDAILQLAGDPPIFFPTITTLYPGRHLRTTPFPRFYRQQHCHQRNRKREIVVVVKAQMQVLYMYEFYIAASCRYSCSPPIRIAGPNSKNMLSSNVVYSNVVYCNLVYCACT